MLTLLEDGQFAVDMMFGNFVCLEFEYFPNFIRLTDDPPPSGVMFVGFLTKL